MTTASAMAALFKVSSYNKPEERKIVKATSIDTLIAGVKTKLKLGEQKYKVLIVTLTCTRFFLIQLPLKLINVFNFYYIKRKY